MSYSVREVVEMALQTEVKGYKFYTETAERFKKNEALKGLFLTLAQEELRHEHVFSKLLGTIKDETPEGWLEIQSYFRAFVESEFFMGTGKALAAIDKIKTEMDAVNLAIGFEKETLLFFIALKDSVKDSAPIDEIIKEETRHVIYLTNLREAIR